MRRQLCQDDLRDRLGIERLTRNPGDPTALQGVEVLGDCLRCGAIPSSPRRGECHGFKGRRQAGPRAGLNGVALLESAPLGASQVVIVYQCISGAPVDVRNRGVAKERIHFLDGVIRKARSARSKTNDLPERDVGGSLGRSVDQKPLASKKVETVIFDPHLTGATGKTAHALVPEIGHDVVPGRVDDIVGGIVQPEAGLEVDGATIGRRGADQQSGWNRPGENIEFEHCPSRCCGRRLIVNQPSQADDRAPLRGRLEDGLSRDPILGVAQVVGERAESFHEHHTEVGLGSLAIPGVTDGRKIGKRFPEAQEVLGQIVDGRRCPGRHRARRRCRGAIQVRLTSCFEREARVVEEAIQSWRRGD